MTKLENEIIERLKKTYRSLRSYADEGVQDDFVSEGQPPVRYEFKTLFKSPNLFFFQVTELESFISDIVGRYSLIFNGEKSKVIYSEDGNKISEEISSQLDLMIARLVGGGGAAITVSSSLLLHDHNPPESFKFISVQKSEEVIIEGDSCSTIIGKLTTGTSVHVHISKATGLVRKVIETSKQARTEQLFRKIRVNEDIPDYIFKI